MKANTNIAKIIMAPSTKEGAFEHFPRVVSIR